MLGPRCASVVRHFALGRCENGIFHNKTGFIDVFVNLITSQRFCSVTVLYLYLTGCRCFAWRPTYLLQLASLQLPCNRVIAFVSVTLTNHGKYVRLMGRWAAYLATPLSLEVLVRSTTYRDLVKAAEKCTAQVIHPGLPADRGEVDIDKWIARGEKYN